MRSSIYIWFLCLSCPADGALRTSKTEHGGNIITDSMFGKHMDDSICSKMPILHDIQNTNDQSIVQEYIKYHTDFLHNYKEELSPGTFRMDKEDLFSDIKVGGNFVFWAQREKQCYYCPYTLLMSAWSYDEENRIIAQKGIYSTDSYAWRFINPHDALMAQVEETITLEGDYVVFVSGFFCLYQHVLIDQLGYLVYMSKILPTTTRILIPRLGEDEMLRTIIYQVDLHLADRIDFINCEQWNTCHTKMITVKNGSLKILRPKSSTRHLELYHLVRSWLWNSQKLRAVLMNESKKTVIYYKRDSGGVMNGRHMDSKQDEEIIQRILHAMKRFGRTEELVLFNGSMSFLDQIKLFHSATTVIGPHGGGLANILLMAPSSSCGERPKVLEFVTSTQTPKVQNGDFNASYFTFYATCPWVELHQVLFTPPSDGESTFINLDALDDALKSLFSRENRSPHSIEMPTLL